METISRSDALARGLLHYFTGKPCKRGHIDQRFVVGRYCAACNRENVSAAYRSLNAEQRAQKYQDKKAYLEQWMAAHREARLAYLARYRQERAEANPDQWKQFYAEHRERRKHLSSEWYHANAEYALKRQKVYDAKRLQEQPEHVRAIGRRTASKRRALQVAAFVENVDPRVVFDRDKGVCGICKMIVDRASRWEIDHIIPLSKGGAHSYENSQLTHSKCNRSKSAKIPSGQPTLFQVLPKSITK
jgi:5-methylcytosine-specific restriction endonuclease McrA